MRTNYGINKVMEYLKSKYIGKIVYIKHDEYYSKQYGLLHFIYFKKDNDVIYREQIEHSHYMDIILDLS